MTGGGYWASAATEPQLSVLLAALATSRAARGSLTSLALALVDVLLQLQSSYFFIGQRAAVSFSAGFFVCASCWLWTTQNRRAAACDGRHGGTLVTQKTGTLMYRLDGLRVDKLFGCQESADSCALIFLMAKWPDVELTAAAVAVGDRGQRPSGGKQWPDLN